MEDLAQTLLWSLRYERQFIDFNVRPSPLEEDVELWRTLNSVENLELWKTLNSMQDLELWKTLISMDDLEP